MNAFADVLGVRFPLLQAPMAGAQAGDLALAVGSAGGLGAVPTATLDRVGRAHEATRVTAAGLPYNLNFFCHAQPEPDPAAEQAWRGRLAPYWDELGVDPATVAVGPGRGTFDADDADLVEELRPVVVSFHFGLPASELVARVKHAGAMVISTATTVDEARWLVAHGADAVIAQGLEAGGHRGNFLSDDLTRQAGTFALLPQVVAAVDVPVIAAGGIATDAGVRAAMTLGASAVQVGTTFLCCDEALTKPLHRAALQDGDRARHTAVTNVFTGRPARGIVNRAVRELGPVSDATPAFPLLTPIMGQLRVAAEAAGIDEFTPLWAGQNTAGVRPGPAADVVAELAAGFA